MNRAQRRQQAKAVASVHAWISGVEDQRTALERQLREQAAEIRATSPGPGETPAEALAAVEKSIADLSAPEYELVAASALEELRAFRVELLAAV